MPRIRRLDALAERDFRLLFVGTTITTVGDRVAAIALAFAVLALPGGSTAQLGIVLAARQVSQALVMVFGGVLADRLPRQLVLVGASIVQGAAQALTAALVLSGTAPVEVIAAVQVVYGIGSGVVIPAEIGLIPQTVSPERLQQANALQGLSRNMIRVLGPAIGGAIVVAGSPGVALAVDAASFFICAAVLAGISVAPRAGNRDRFIVELFEGWQEFISRPWLWKTVVLFGISNAIYLGCWTVLGPAIAKNDLGGAGAWGLILAAGGVGSIAGGIASMRFRPVRPLWWCIVFVFPFLLQLVGLALALPVPWLVVINFVAGVTFSLHVTLWITVFQQQIPEHVQSRVSSYDTLGSYVLTPLGMILVGPLAVGIGIAQTLWIAIGISAICTGIMLSMPSVWAIKYRKDRTLH